MPAPEPILVPIAGRKFALRWSNLAAYRIDTLRPKPRLQDIREGSGLAFLIQHLWALLADDTDRRQFSDPAELAAVIDITDEPQMRHLWRTMWQLAYQWDPEAPALATAAAGAAADTMPPRPEADDPNAGAKPSPSPA